MKAKEKAIQLVKMFSVADEYDFYKIQAKKHAINCVDEKIKSAIKASLKFHILVTDGRMEYITNKIKLHYQEVKKEIQRVI